MSARNETNILHTILDVQNARLIEYIGKEQLEHYITYIYTWQELRSTCPAVLNERSEFRNRQDHSP